MPTHVKLVFKYAFTDLKNQKIRTALGLIGIMISVGLLAIVLFLSDSISSSFVDYLSADAGEQDMNISVRHYNDEPEDRSSYFKYDEIINQVEATTDEIQDYIPRMRVTGTLFMSEGFDTRELTEFEQTTTIYGIDFSLENSINFGTFTIPEEDVPSGFVSLAPYECAIYYQFNNLIKYSVGDYIEIEMKLTHGDETITKIIKFHIAEIFDYNLKFPNNLRDDNLIVVDIDTLYDIFGEKKFEGRCSELILTFKSGNELYDIRDIDGTERRVKAIAEDIQLELGIHEYDIDLPKLGRLAYVQFFTLGITVIFVFVSIIAMLISGILINGILNTSVEERIREFGIFRTLGAYKSYNLAIVLVQGFMLSFFGTTLGLINSYFITDLFILPFAENVLAGGFGLQGEIVFTLNIWSVIMV